MGVLRVDCMWRFGASSRGVQSFSYFRIILYLNVSRGTIRDDRIDSTAASNVQSTKDQPWYDKLASDDDDKIRKSDPVTNEREKVSERTEQQVNDSVKPQYVCVQYVATYICLCSV